MNKEEQKECSYLVEIQKYLHTLIVDLDENLLHYANDIKKETTYLGESRYEMDFAEKITIRQGIEAMILSADRANELKQRYIKMRSSPYFGRFDFKSDDSDKTAKVYIGLRNLLNNQDKLLICDWRAPIASMFYNYELGPAEYQAPTGIKSGKVLLKRQFRIRDGKIEFMLESSVNVMDDILQKELSRTSDEGMKNIVATIQRDQNTVIRDETSNTLIIQGVTGSGKTSIALHRIAFLLYRFKDTIKSEDILIISPNKVFADYISNVLPELGEEAVGEVQMEVLARDLLGEKITFQSFFEQTAKLLDGNDGNYQNRIQIKASLDFIAKLEDYAKHVQSGLFSGQDIFVGGCYVPAWLFDEIFIQNKDYSKEECVKNITNTVADRIALQYNYKLEAGEKNELKKKILKMHHGAKILEVYKNFFTWLNQKTLFKTVDKSKLEYADVFPMVYLKILLESKSIIPRQAKHLIIDEMQDYTAVQYAVIAKLFRCNKTILGDSGQSVNPYSASDAESIQITFPNSSFVKLNKSYRSTFEIIEFVQRILNNPELQALKRHGEVPQLINCANEASEFDEIKKIIKAFSKTENNTLGIICKTQKQAQELFTNLQSSGCNIDLLDEKSESFHQGVLVCGAHMAKGLEFDWVIVPNVTNINYNNPIDKNMLYVACTRAMHKLVLTYCKEASGFVSTSIT